VKLKVHLIAGGKYYPIGTEIPEDELPEFAMKYSVSSDDDLISAAAPVDQASFNTFTESERPKPRRRSRRATYVLRNGEYVPVNTLDGATYRGETLYWHRQRGIGQPAAYIKFGTAK
jgi:hypothetical protein